MKKRRKIIPYNPPIGVTTLSINSDCVARRFDVLRTLSNFEDGDLSSEISKRLFSWGVPYICTNVSMNRSLNVIRRMILLIGG